MRDYVPSVVCLRSGRVEGAGQAAEPPKSQRKADDELKQDSFWPHLGTFLRDGDVILAETGTSLFGILGASSDND